MGSGHYVCLVFSLLQAKGAVN